MATFLDHRVPITVAFLVFVPVACFEKDCGPDQIDCEGDRSCPTESVCRQDTDGCGDVVRHCVAVTECSSDADCLDGEACVLRPGEPAANPFEHDVAERGVCGCGEDESCRPFAASGTTGGGSGGEAAASVSVSIASTTTLASGGGDGGGGAEGGGGRGGGGSGDGGGGDGGAGGDAGDGGAAGSGGTAGGGMGTGGAGGAG